MKFAYTNTYNAFRKYCEYEGFYKLDRATMENLNKTFNEKFEVIYETQPRIIIDNSYTYWVEEVISYNGYLLFVIGNQTAKILYNYVIDDKECEVLGRDLKDRLKHKMYSVANHKVGDVTINIMKNKVLIDNKKIPVVNTFDMFINYCDNKNLIQSKSVNERIYNSFIKALSGKSVVEMASVNFIENEQSYYFDYINLKNELIIIQKYAHQEPCPF